jgi:hypothetical protein
MNKSGRAVGEENVTRLRSYLASLEQEGTGVPMSGGKPNLSAVALACGFDRQVLYKNPACRSLLEERCREIGGADVTAHRAAEGHDPRDKRIRELEKRVCDLQEKLEGALAEIADLRQYRLLYEHALSTGRDL